MPIELLMAITLLGIVAATLVPQMLRNGETARQSELLHRLHLVRGRIEQFRDTHSGRLPAEGRNSANSFLDDLASFSHPAGQVSSASDFGSDRSSSHEVPSSQTGGRIPPVNPYTNASAILVIPDRLIAHHYSGSGRHGWAYSSTTGEFRANLSPATKDRSGRLINQL